MRLAVTTFTISRQYNKWRREHEIPVRCDNESVAFTRSRWSGTASRCPEPLPLILDHKEGNRLDNRPAKLQYLCPNCDSQLKTRGGLNKGRVEGATEDYQAATKQWEKAAKIFRTAGDLINAKRTMDYADGAWEAARKSLREGVEIYKMAHRYYETANGFEKKPVVLGKVARNLERLIDMKR